MSQPSTSGAGELQGLQKDATGVLLMARGMDRSLLRQYVPQPAGTPFLAGVPDAELIESVGLEALTAESRPPIEAPDDAQPGDDEVRTLHLGKVTEDQLIDNDADRVPYAGWFRVHDRRVGWRTFTDGQKRMEIFNANRNDGEHEMGVDLIYRNVAHDSFVMVQYKRMRMETELVYRPSSDRNLQGELDRMRRVDQECSQRDAVSSDDVRLLATPCLIKLCAPQTVVLDSTELITGIYLGREHFEALLSSPRCVGPRGGVQMTFANVPRHLNNTIFADLLGSGWIGSRGRGSDYVGQQVHTSLEAGRSVVVGVDRTPRTPKNRRMRT